MSDLQHIEYLKGRIDQLEQQLKLERSFYQEELSRISSSITSSQKSIKASIQNLRMTIANNRRDSEVLFSSVWTIRE
ncbi:MAG: hypothetical protein ACK6BS_01140 [Pseudanabaena sp.]|jgi:hypothetical protein|uniref:hypothetical protein n=1 Tax=unclassified Microcystis TaxID=2643300 RepID=UPI00258296D4|nr:MULTISPECIES: hypothetical protein [unclassified Microcystis]MCA2917542.1 hypothetical protein [Microcystis sp. M017S1]MCA2929633.1 hypothetical protein [Microcystis sp. M018S1]MCA6548725.1 hypothetical protein [Pseudanabaena sp. M152S2SP2A07QC]MCA6605271.1 hypothetical protein [Pseudanabaena sp. M007S1SP1A06QC]